jgi:hypothetical protein
MSKIVRVPEDVSGKRDAVEMMTECATANFALDGAGESVSIAGPINKHSCKIMASVSNGTVSISARGVGTMITVRMDELADVINAAIEANEDT